MTPTELIEQLDSRYGNPLAPDCKLIQQGIALLREQDEQLKQYEKFIAISELERMRDERTKTIG